MADSFGKEQNIPELSDPGHTKVAPKNRLFEVLYLSHP
jgi:hypothetical protein